MSQFPGSFRGSRPGPMAYEGRDVDSLAVSQFFNAVYAWMFAGLGLTAAVAWYVSGQPQLMAKLFQGPLIWVCFIAEFGLVAVVSAAVNRLSASVATLLFMLYAGLNGLTLSVIFLVYSHAAINQAFIISAGMFGAMSVYGHLTKRDLTGLGSFMFMGLVGLILASVVSIFWANSLLIALINFVGVIIFVGLTAYDTQKLRSWAVQLQGDPAMAARMSVSGALALYLDFINIFLFILRILGSRDNQR